MPFRSLVVPEVAAVQAMASVLVKMAPPAPTATKLVPSKTTAFTLIAPSDVPAVHVAPAGRGVAVSTGLVSPTFEPSSEAAMMKAYCVPLTRSMTGWGELAPRTDL
jgi:hypothetical protein